MMMQRRKMNWNSRPLMLRKQNRRCHFGTMQFLLGFALLAVALLQLVIVEIWSPLDGDGARVGNAISDSRLPSSSFNQTATGTGATARSYGSPEQEHDAWEAFLAGDDRDNSDANKMMMSGGGRQVSPLGDEDRQFYTVRINTWKRNAQLIAAVDHVATCEGVASVQIIWCDQEAEPPAEIANHGSGKVVIEHHTINNLNERFRILEPAPTLGILNIDDDIVRPCEALDAGFFKWTQAPDRMVGYDSRMHVESDDGTWQYGYQSTTFKANRYTISLTRCCFLHRDYLDWYTNNLPRSIYDKVAVAFNCEDIAMSFMVSSRTNGQPPLLADCWAIQSMIKMETGSKISGTKNHKRLRDECVDSFAHILGVKDDGDHALQSATIMHKHDKLVRCGAALDGWDASYAGGSTELQQRQPHRQERLRKLSQMIERWRNLDSKSVRKEMGRMMYKAAAPAYKRGLIRLKS